MGERFHNEPWGVFGGEPGRCGRFLLRGTEGEKLLPSKPAEVHVTAAQAIVVETPGAGGYGPPCERSKDALRSDRREDRYSPEFLARHYGFAEQEKVDDRG